jgi:sugar/nucleoside kinase (ribokinase family)
VLVTLGDLMLDIVVSPAWPIERGTDVPGRVTFRQGGSAANTARAFARLGGSARLVAAVGDDEWARPLVAALRADGVRTHPVSAAEPTGRVAAIVAPDGERSFVTQRGAADALRAAHLEAAWFRGADVLHLPGYSVFSRHLAGAARRAVDLSLRPATLVSVDLSSRVPLLAFGVAAAREQLEELRPDVLFANRDEAAALLGSRSSRSLPGLLSMAPLAVVKDGAAGCRVLWRDSGAEDGARAGPGGDGVAVLDVAVSRLAATDTTGAGDSFAAGFLHALASADPHASAPGVAERTWAPVLLRRAALAGHRSAAALLRGGRPELHP